MGKVSTLEPISYLKYFTLDGNSCAGAFDGLR